MTNTNSIIFKNSGTKLQYQLEEYFKPFFKDQNIVSNHSFGLGLYIVKHIIDASGFELCYNYKENMNIFTLTQGGV